MAMTEEDDKEFNRQWNVERMTHNLDYMAKHCHRDYTRAELADATGLRLSSVCGRAAELLALYVLSEGPRRPCRCTGINAHPLRLAPAQMDLL